MIKSVMIGTAALAMGLAAAVAGSAPAYAFNATCTEDTNTGCVIAFAGGSAGSYFAFSDGDSGTADPFNFGFTGYSDAILMGEASGWTQIGSGWTATTGTYNGQTTPAWYTAGGSEPVGLFQFTGPWSGLPASGVFSVGIYEAPGDIVPGTNGVSDIILAYNVNGMARIAFYSGDSNVTIPEPATWAMLLLGFGGLGFAGYRARKRTAALAI